MRVSSPQLVAVLLVGGMAGGCQGLPPAEAPLVVTGPVVVDPTTSVVVGPTLPPAQPGVPAAPAPVFAAPQPAFTPPVAAGPTAAIAPQIGLPVAETSAAALPNPLKVPVSNHDYAWDQIVDVVADYFPIAREQRVHIDRDLWTEGRVETPYQVGATLFEPHRKDSVGAFNKWQSTLQTIRRRAMVRVVPEPDGYLVDIQVDRELEDLARPEEATSGLASLLRANSLPSNYQNQVSRTEWSPIWIPLGRDIPLEQRMLADIRDRLALTPQVPMTISPVQ